MHKQSLDDLLAAVVRVDVRVLLLEHFVKFLLLGLVVVVLDCSAVGCGHFVAYAEERAAGGEEVSEDKC